MTLGRVLNWLEGVDRRREAVVFALWAFWLTCLNFMGPLAHARFKDNADGNIPFHISAALHPSLWYPFQGSGVDLLAQGMFNDIEVLFFLALPPWLAVAAVLFLQRFISGVFTFRLLREHLQLRPIVALFGALEFAAFMTGFTDYSNGLCLGELFSLPLIPAVFWLLPKIAARERWSYLLATALGVLVAVLTLYIWQVPLVPFFIVWFWLAVRQRSKHFWGLFAAFLIAYLVAELPAILISAANAVGSYRVELADYFMLGIQGRLSHLVDWTLLYPVQLALTIAGVVCFLSERPHADIERHRRVFAVALGYLGFLKLFHVLYPLVWQHVWQHLPLIRGFQIERLHYAESFLLTVTACLGLELLAPRVLSLRLPRNIKLSAERLAAASIALVLTHSLILQGITVAYQFSGRVGGFNFSTLYGDENLLALKAMTKDDPPFRVQGSDHTHAAWLAAYAFESTGGYLNIYPQRYKEFWAQVLLPIADRDPEHYLYFINFGGRIYLYGPPFNMALLSLANVRFIASSDPLDAPELERVEGARPLVERKRRWEDLEMRERLFSYFKNTYPGVAPYIYENKRYLPRVFSVGVVRAFDSKQGILEGLSAATLESLTTSVYLEQADAAAISSAGTLGPAQVQVVSHQADEWIVATLGERPSVLVVTNSFNPYWRAYVDGVPAKVLPAYHAFQAVAVPAGTHQVTLRYEPPYRLFFEPALRSLHAVLHNKTR